MLRRCTIALFVPTLIFGVWFATNSDSEAPPVKATAAAAVVEPSKMQIQTGDRFWGLHLDGIVACSSLLVKGGGHLVMITPLDDPELKCYYHVKDEKVVELNGLRFKLVVTGEDTAYVDRSFEERLAANTP